MNEKIKSELSLAEQAYRLLRESILTNKLRPDSFWSDKELCAEFGLSRTPIREALVRLQADQLVQIVPRKGTRIIPLAMDDVREIHQLAKALELEAALTIARMENRRELIKPLGDHVSAMEAAITVDDREKWVVADEKYHLLTVDLCGNRRLAEIYHSQRALTDRARYFALHMREKPVQSTTEHRAMYEAILAGELDELERIYRQHWDRTTTELLSIIERQAQNSPFPNYA